MSERAALSTYEEKTRGGRVLIVIDGIGSILLRKTNLTEEDLQAALIVQEKSGERLGEILVKQKKIKELDLLQALSDQFRMDVVPVLPSDIVTDFTKIIPIAFLKRTSWYR